MKTTLNDLNTAMSLLDIESEWTACVHFKTIRLYDDNSYKSITGNDKSVACHKIGVYRHTAVIDGETVVLYVGMSMARTSSIAGRQSSHLGSFKNLDNTNEMTGKKYRRFIRDLGVEYLDITIEYVDLTHLNTSIIPFFEVVSINYFRPLINQDE
jgi:hypothetical protein